MKGAMDGLPLRPVQKQRAPSFLAIKDLFSVAEAADAAAAAEPPAGVPASAFAALDQKAPSYNERDGEASAVSHPRRLTSGSLDSQQSAGSQVPPSIHSPLPPPLPLPPLPAWLSRRLETFNRKAVTTINQLQRPPNTRIREHEGPAMPPTALRFTKARPHACRVPCTCLQINNIWCPLRPLSQHTIMLGAAICTHRRPSSRWIGAQS
jgi:hypothetical protein